MDFLSIKPIGQIIGIIAMFLAVYSFQLKENQNLFKLQLISAILFSIHFYILGAYAAVGMNILALVRGLLLCSNYKWAKGKTALVALLICIITSGIFTYNGIISLLPVIAIIISTISFWSFNGKIIRFTQLFSTSPMWLTYNLFTFSIGGIITESFNIISVIVSLIRFGLNGFKNEG